LQNHEKVTLAVAHFFWKGYISIVTGDVLRDNFLRDNFLRDNFLRDNFFSLDASKLCKQLQTQTNVKSENVNLQQTQIFYM